MPCCWMLRTAFWVFLKSWVEFEFALDRAWRNWTLAGGWNLLAWFLACGYRGGGDEAGEEGGLTYPASSCFWMARLAWMPLARSLTCLLWAAVQVALAFAVSASGDAMVMPRRRKTLRNFMVRMGLDGLAEERAKDYEKVKAKVNEWMASRKDQQRILSKEPK